MMMKNNVRASGNTRKQFFGTLITAFAGFFLMSVSLVLNPVNHYVNGLFLVLCSVILYFFCVLTLSDKNWMDIRAVFSLIWFSTIGLASFRLTDYQEPWQRGTWFLVAVTYAMFQVGAALGIYGGYKMIPPLMKKAKNLRLGRIGFKLQENRLFWICIVTTVVGLVCFIINVFIRGYIPCFSDSPTAYVDFYTRLHVFSVASTGVCGLCYYCIRTQKISVVKRVVLWSCIFYELILFPILVVSRGTFVVAAVSFTVVVFYLHKKKFISLVLCLLVILGVYMISSKIRGYTDAQLQVFFEPSKITVDPSGVPNSSKGTDTNADRTDSLSTDSEISSSSTDSDISMNGTDSGVDSNDSDVISFSLSPKMAFLYGYLTVSHDNFNEAVQNTKNFSLGIRQLQPFNVILRSQWVSMKAEGLEHHLVRPHLNTTNLIGDFYYDFGALGVIFCTLIWAFVFGFIQSFYEKSGDAFSLLVLGNSMIPIALCFFASWLSVFSQWLLWGVVLIFWVAACLKIKSRKR